MRSLVITVPAAQRNAVNAALESRGYGPNNLSVQMTDGEPTPRDEDGNLLATPTHYSSHWWVTESEYTELMALRESVLVGATFRAQHDLGNVRGLFNATNGDYVRVTHHQFDNDQWGWRAEFVVQADEFEAGVRAIAIYADADHQNYFYTTGAFTKQDERWITEWNEGKASPADVHWALLWASQIEAAHTLAADDVESLGFLRAGVTGDPVPPPAGGWQDSGETVTSLIGAGVIGVTDTAPFSAGQAIRINGTEATVSSIFTPGVPGVLVISPHIGVSGGEMIEVFV